MVWTVIKDAQAIWGRDVLLEHSWAGRNANVVETRFWGWGGVSGKRKTVHCDWYRSKRSEGSLSTIVRRGMLLNDAPSTLVYWDLRKPRTHMPDCLSLGSKLEHLLCIWLISSCLITRELGYCWLLYIHPSWVGYGETGRLMTLWLTIIQSCVV